MVQFLQLSLFEPEGSKAFRLKKPIYQDGNRYTHRIRWFLAEMSVPGLHREEVAREIGKALHNSGAYKYTRTRLRGQADMIIYVQPGAYNSVVPGPDKIAIQIQPAYIPKIHQIVLEALKQYETPQPTG